MFMMKTILFIVPVFLSFTIFFLFGCGTSKENSLALQMQADSVIVEVSTKLKSGSILFAKGKCIRISTNGVETEPDRVPLVAKESVWNSWLCACFLLHPKNQLSFRNLNSLEEQVIRHFMSLSVTMDRPVQCVTKWEKKTTA